MPMTAKEVLSTARLAACRLEPYFTTAFMALVPREAPGLGTMAVTKDWTMLYDPEALVQWGVAKTTTVIRHEVRHCIRDHHGRGTLLGGEEVADLKNIAADCEINDGAEFSGAEWPGQIVTPRGLGFPDGLLFEDYFDRLRKKQEQQQKQQGGKGQPQKQDGEQKQQGSGGSGGQPPKGPGQEQQTDGEGGGKEEQPQQKPVPGNGWCGSCAGRAVPGEPEDGGDDDEKRSEVEQRRVRKQVAESIQQAAQRGRGTIPGSWLRWADQQLQPPKIPWQQKLAKVVRASVAYRAGAVDRRFTHPSRRQAAIGYGPGRPLLAGLRAPVPRVAVVVDTSGSMGTDEMNAAVGETNGVLKAVGSDIEFCACDAKVHSLATLRSPRDLGKLLKGGGGTDFRPAFDALSKRRLKPEIVVFITDGCGPAPEHAPEWARVIWVLVGPYKASPCSWGEQIKVE